MPSYQILHEAGVFVLHGDHALEGEEASVVHSQGDLAGLAEGLGARFQQRKLVPTAIEERRFSLCSINCVRVA